ncbi:MAG: Holliday junction branch migration protein RuvA [Bacteroidales bacterium]|nr:Holliday junction branch migration protein RuvA [Bacteroidales bacterium]
MIDYIKGKIVELLPTDLVIECGGIGYHAFISLQTYALLENKSEATVYMHHILREDEEMFYGFADKDERQFFRLLIGVSGVGAGTARVMLSSLNADEIREAILTEDVKRIQSIKGIGNKTAQRIILELKDKVAKVGSNDSSALFSGAQVSAVAEEATTALIMLGFAKPAVSKVVGALLKEMPNASVEQLIKEALGRL